MPTKRHCAELVGRTLAVVLIVIGAAGILCHLVSLILGPQSESISEGMHAGASLFVMAISAGMVLLGVDILRSHLDVDSAGMRCERTWITQRFNVTWDKIASWGLRVVIEKGEANDGWGTTFPTETRREQLEIEVSHPPRRIVRAQKSPYYPEIVEALRTNVPAKERPSPVEIAWWT